MFGPLTRWTRTSTPKCRQIVLEILKASHPTPLNSQAIYQRVRSEYPHETVPIPPPLHDNNAPSIPRPPHPDHPIRSLKYLKSIVLEDLVVRGEIEKVHSMRQPTPEEVRLAKQPRNKSKKRAATAPVVLNFKGMIDQWRWVLKSGDPEEDERERARIKKAIEGQKDAKVLMKEERNNFLGEWGHLNTRRQRAREEKLEREGKWARMLERGRQEGMAAAERPDS